MKYQVLIVGDKPSYLSHRDRTSWSLRTAKRHAREFTERHGKQTVLEDV